jgi:hypothetical protein
MKTSLSYQNYPIRIVILSNFVSLSIYVLGFLIINRLGLVFSFLYLLYILAFEFRLIKYHCTNCFYWSKICGFGKGRLSSYFFKKGDISKFCGRHMTWQDVIPDILISLMPLIVGIFFLILRFEIILLSGLIFLILLTTFGNSIIRGKLTCRHCKQKEIGCPAELLFNKNK